MTQPASQRRWLPVALIALAAVVLAGVGWWLFERANRTEITAYFDRSVGIYSGSDVRVLGVPVGTVNSVDPIGDQVKVVMTVDRGYDIPAGASAVQITPSVVSDRYIQLTPAYSGGPTMESGATIPRDRTATPVEVDELYRSVTELSEALGPTGANQNGAVSDLVSTGAANLGGNGEALGNSITELSRAARYLADTRGDIFATVDNLQRFVTMLAASDDQVRQFNTQLADISTFLAGERQDLGESLRLLSIALGDVARFVDNNRDLIVSNVQGLTEITQTVADQRDQLASALVVLPVALSNLVNVHNAESGTLDMRANIPEIGDPLSLVCKLIDLGKLRPGDPAFEQLGAQMRPIIDNCKTITDQITAGIKTPSLILPFGILSTENQQRYPVPGTVPGNPSPRQTEGGG